jgi:hypothetical protein
VDVDEGPAGPTGPTGAQGWNNFTCRRHAHYQVAPQKLIDAIRNEDGEFLRQYYFKVVTHGVFNAIPHCFLLDEARSYSMVSLLISQGARCTRRSKLAQMQLGFQVKSVSVSNLDDAVQEGDLETVRYFLKRDTVHFSLSAPHWRDFLVQDFFIRELTPRLYSELQVFLNLYLPNAITSICVHFWLSWDNVFGFMCKLRNAASYRCSIS